MPVRIRRAAVRNLEVPPRLEVHTSFGAMRSCRAVLLTVADEAGCPDAPVEWDIKPNLLRTELTATPFEIRDGAIEIPVGPGLGWAPRAGELA